MEQMPNEPSEEVKESEDGKSFRYIENGEKVIYRVEPDSVDELVSGTYMGRYGIEDPEEEWSLCDDDGKEVHDARFESAIIYVRKDENGMLSIDENTPHAVKDEIKRVYEEKRQHSVSEEGALSTTESNKLNETPKLMFDGMSYEEALSFSIVGLQTSQGSFQKNELGFLEERWKRTNIKTVGVHYSTGEVKELSEISDDVVSDTEHNTGRAGDYVLIDIPKTYSGKNIELDEAFVAVFDEGLGFNEIFPGLDEAGLDKEVDEESGYTFYKAGSRILTKMLLPKETIELLKMIKENESEHNPFLQEGLVDPEMLGDLLQKVKDFYVQNNLPKDLHPGAATTYFEENAKKFFGENALRIVNRIPDNVWRDFVSMN